MVGIVIVAHSAQLAEAVITLAKQMLRREVPIAAAGGIDDPQNPFGTDATKIQQAIESVYSEDGVVILMDIGSAILSAETALEFLSEEQRTHVRLCAAPLVEGAIAAAVSAEGGASLEQVMDEASGALAAKASQIGVPETPAQAPVQSQPAGKEIRLVIHNRLGIHARPAARFVSTASQFKSEIMVRNLTRNTGAVSARSINMVATLGVRQGHEIAVSASGADAEAALEALRKLVESNLGETEQEAPAVPGKKSGEFIGRGTLKGVPISPGIAIGPAVFYQPRIIVSQVQAESPEAEWRKLEAAIEAVRQETRKVRARLAGKAEDEAGIFDAHLLSLEDPALLALARQKIFEKKNSAAAAWQEAVSEILKSYNAVADDYIRSRGADLEDLRAQVLQKLSGVAASFALNRPAIVLAGDFKPSDIVRLDMEKVLGIATVSGSTNSHAAILVRALGIPAVFGLGQDLLHISEGAVIGLDGSQGLIATHAEVIEDLRRQRQAWLASRQQSEAGAQKAALTLDGVRITVEANIGSMAEACIALRQGADGIGVVRTEFLFLDRATTPSEDEQYTAYREIAAVFREKPVIIRTLDAGADKPLPYLNMPAEANPALGQRGIRLTLANPGLFKAQLRAILRASPGHQLKVMFPMVSTLEEVRQAKELLSQARAELKSAVPFEKIKVGIMIEVPSAALLAEELAREVDFFSIGTNDLTQYTLALDRTGSSTKPCDALHPAVLQLIKMTAQAGKKAGIPVAVCGEIACDKAALQVLLGLGITELSLSPASIPEIKQAIRTIRLSEAWKIAEDALNPASGA